MKVLYQTYSLAHQNPGGGERVIAHLHAELRALGVEVVLRDSWIHHPQEFDIFHYFSLSESAHFPFFKQNCQKTKIVVTPTFYHGSAESKLARWKETIGAKFGIFENKRLRDVHSVDHFFPNTAREANDLHIYFGIPKGRISIMANGISPIFGQVSPQRFHEFAKIEGDFVLHVGRFDPVKNQDFLVRSLENLDIQVVFIGNPSPFSSEYFQFCRELANKSKKAKFYFFQNILPDSELLASAMKAAKVFAMPSNFETFGIAALEAQVSGCQLILSTGFSEREVFRSAKFLPLVESLWAESVRQELQSPTAPVASTASEAGTENPFSWREIAKRLHGEYQKLLLA